MADLEDLFSKFDSNKIKHRRKYEFTIEKFEKILDDSNELDLENEPLDGSDFDESASDESEDLEDELEQIDKESDNEDIDLEKKYVNNYCNEIKRKMTSTPLYPDNIPLKSTILTGISPLIRSIDKKKMLAKTPRNILNTVRENNLLKKINNKTTPKLDDKSVILCKPNKENTLHPMPHKLDFNFELSDEDDEHDAKKSPKKLPNMFEPKPSAVLDSNNDMLNLSPPSPSDKLKDYLNNFARTSKNSSQLEKNNLLEKMHQDMELSLPNTNDKLKEICVKFSQEKSNKGKNQTSPIIGLNKTSDKEKNTQQNKSSDKCDESDDETEDDRKLSDLAKKHIKTIPKKKFMQSTPMPSQNTQMERLDFSGLPTATPNDKMKKLSESIADSSNMDVNVDQNDHVPEMTAKFKNSKKSKIIESTPNPLSNFQNRINNGLEDISNLSVRNNGNQIEISISDSLNAEMPKTKEKNRKSDKTKSQNKLNGNGTVLQSQNNDFQIVEVEKNKKVSESIADSSNMDVNVDQNDHVPEMTAKFKNSKKSKIIESTPNPLSNFQNRINNGLEDISNLSVRNNGNQMEISFSDSINAETPKTIDINRKSDKTKSQNKLNGNENGTVLQDQNDDIHIIEVEKNSKVDMTHKENLVKKKSSALEGRNVEKKSDKRILNLSNVSFDSKRPDLKKICMDHFQEKVLKNCHQDTSIVGVNLQTNKKFRSSNRPDLLKVCQDKFKEVIRKTERKEIKIGKETSVLGREFSRDSKQKHNVLAFFK